MEPEKGQENVLVFCAHNDDNIIGAGGTLAKYAREGKEVLSVIFSYGEKAHPLLKSHEAIRMRVLESKKADSVIGAKGMIYLGLKEGKFAEQIAQKRLGQKIKRIINSKKPVKIFTHSPDDPHPDHRAVHQTVMEVTDKIRHKCDIYSFDIWNPLNVRQRDKPRLVVDITQTMAQKIRAVRLHSSQWMTLLTMVPAIYIRGLANGLYAGSKYAEVFVKIR